MSQRLTRVTTLSCVFLAAIFVIGQPASARSAETEPANLVVSMDAGSGSLTKLDGGGFRLKLDLKKGKAQVRSIENKGLLGAKPVAFGQRPDIYFSTWNQAFPGDSRSAAITVTGEGELLSLELSKPRFDRSGSTVSFDAKKRTLLGSPFKKRRGQRLNVTKGEFGSAKLRMNDNGWVRAWAHLNAYPPSGACQGDPTDPVFSCHGRGEGGGMSPWRGDVSFGSFRGGMDFWASGSQPLEGYLPSYGKLFGDQNWGWGGNALVINDKSYYEIPAGGCKRRPVSGTDKSLAGQPGGTMHVELREGGNFFEGYGYILDVQGYLSEAYYDKAAC